MRQSGCCPQMTVPVPTAKGARCALLLQRPCHGVCSRPDRSLQFSGGAGVGVELAGAECCIHPPASMTWAGAASVGARRRRSSTCAGIERVHERLSCSAALRTVMEPGCGIAGVNDIGGPFDDWPKFNAMKLTSSWSGLFSSSCMAKYTTRVFGEPLPLPFLPLLMDVDVDAVDGVVDEVLDLPLPDDLGHSQSPIQWPRCPRSRHSVRSLSCCSRARFSWRERLPETSKWR